MTASSQSPSSGKIIKPASSAPAETPAATPAVASAPTPDSSAPRQKRRARRALPARPAQARRTWIKRRPWSTTARPARAGACPRCRSAPCTGARSQNAAAPSERTATPVAAPQPAPMAKSAAAPSDKAATPAAPQPRKAQTRRARRYFHRLPSTVGPVFQHRQRREAGQGTQATRHPRAHGDPGSGWPVQEPGRGRRDHGETARPGIRAAAGAGQPVTAAHDCVGRHIAR